MRARFFPAVFTVLVLLGAARAHGEVATNTPTPQLTPTPTPTSNRIADLSVTKVAAPDPVGVGRDLTYTVTVHNAGPNFAQGVSLHDTLPASVTLVSVSAPPDWSCFSGSGSVSCSTSSLLFGGNSRQFVIVVRPTAAGPLTNTAQVQCSLVLGCIDPNPSNDMASVTTEAVECPAPCAITPPPNPLIVTDCSGTGSSPVTTTSSWTQINMPSADVILRCPLTQLPGTSGTRILAHSIVVDGPGGGSVGSSGTSGTQLIAGSGSGQCNALAAVDVETASVSAGNPNGNLKITGCGDILVNRSMINSGNAPAALTSSAGRVCITEDSLSGGAVTVTANGDLTMSGTTVAVAASPDMIKLTSNTGSVLAGGGLCAPNRFAGGNDSNMAVSADKLVDLTGACVEVGQNITITAAGNGLACDADIVINLNGSEIRNDFGLKGVITATACGGVGKIDIGNAILLDNGKNGGGSDPNKVSNLNGSLATLPINCASATTPVCTARPLDAASNPVSADPADRASHNVVGVPRCDS